MLCVWYTFLLLHLFEDLAFKSVPPYSYTGLTVLNLGYM